MIYIYIHVKICYKKSGSSERSDHIFFQISPRPSQQKAEDGETIDDIVVGPLMGCGKRKLHPRWAGKKTFRFSNW